MKSGLQIGSAVRYTESGQSITGVVVDFHSITGTPVIRWDDTAEETRMRADYLEEVA